MELDPFVAALVVLLADELAVGHVVGLEVAEHPRQDDAEGAAGLDQQLVPAEAEHVLVVGGRLALVAALQRVDLAVGDRRHEAAAGLGLFVGEGVLAEGANLVPVLQSHQH